MQEDLPYEVEHIMPDYSLYGITDTAYGYMTRGCPRGCFFCHVKDKEGTKSVKVADLNEFWSGQKNIILNDPNTLACKDWRDILQQLIDSKAVVEFNQGIDVRLCTGERLDMLNKIRLSNPHFAWDRYEDKDIVLPRFKEIAERMSIRTKAIAVYVLTNFDSTIDQDIERVETLRGLGFSPYVMRYNKQSIPRGSKLNALARYCNNRTFLWRYGSFEEYLAHSKETH